ncbi:MAG TPA: hypothetical protein VGQ69_14580 [Gemmatimonadales bacterium]|nr:hypothetical protein [Gemmatimonadales bacterium]
MKRLALLAVVAAGCAALQQIAALRQVNFSLAGVQRGRLAGVDLSRVTSYNELTAVEVGRIALALAQQDLPLEFQLDVRAENPADNNVTATMLRLAWSLFLNEKETINGVIDTSLALPPGQPVNIPFQMRLNLLQFFEGPAQDLFNLAAALAGRKADPTRISLRAVPTINTPIGPISYPAPITIVSRTVGG